MRLGLACCALSGVGLVGPYRTQGGAGGFPWAGVLRPFRALVLSVLLGPTGLGGESLLSPHVGEPVAADRFGSLFLVVSRASADDLRAHVVVGIGIEN